GFDLPQRRQNRLAHRLRIVFGRCGRIRRRRLWVGGLAGFQRRLEDLVEDRQDFLGLGAVSSQLGDQGNAKSRLLFLLEDIDQERQLLVRLDLAYGIEGGLADLGVAVLEDGAAQRRQRELSLAGLHERQVRQFLGGGLAVLRILVV